MRVALVSHLHYADMRRLRLQPVRCPVSSWSKMMPEPFQSPLWAGVSGRLPTALVFIRVAYFIVSGKGHHHVAGGCTPGTERHSYWSKQALQTSCRPSSQFPRSYHHRAVPRQIKEDKVQDLKTSPGKQQSVFENSKGDGEASVRASYAIAELIAKNCKCYGDSEFVKQCLVETAEIVCPEKVQNFRKISWSPNTTAQRVDDITRNLNEQLLVKAKSFVAFSIAVNESTDVSGEAHDVGSEFEGLPYHAEVRWLSCFNVLKRFWLIREIRLFLEMKGESVDQLCDDNWLQI
ncbi:hypothetical protein PR048_008885 [Dryococelus australis]|uniref:Uncharacterized protein n=1 Tax=Dryococelus australis TaxID=614101 RepID=A0ABQ9HZ60_9NEOP|nr:hypothetical protein PR048_008885 [Dryococelus australis]